MADTGLKIINFKPISKLTILGLSVLLTLSPAASKTNKSLKHRVAQFEKGLRPSISIQGTKQKKWTIKERMAHYKIPGMSLAIIKNGKIIFAKGYGVKEAGTKDKVNINTVFSVGSLSKIGAAATGLRLVAQGDVSLDKPVNDYLKRWQVPSNIYTQTYPVTLRGLMSHSAGLSLDGFPDFKPGEALPTVINTLDGTFPSRTVPVRAFYVPGTRWAYSGGGTTVTQLLIEDVSGLSFPAAAKKYVFDQLGMSRSTYQNPLPASHGNIAKAHDEKGSVTALPRGWHAFPEMAASGLWTTPSDYARMIISFMESYKGKKNSFLPQDLAKDMMTEVGVSPVGLGPFLDGTGYTRRFRHGGSNESYQAWMEGHLERGTGVVIFTNGVKGSDLYSEVKRAIADAFEWPFYHKINIPNIKLTPQELSKFTGQFQADKTVVNATQRFFIDSFQDKQIITFVVKNKVLWLSNEYQTDLGPRTHLTRLIPTGLSQFIIEGRDRLENDYVEFVRGLNGHITNVIFHGSNNNFIFHKKGN